MAQKSKTGFTLMELLMVIAVIGILAALMLPALTSSKTAARRKKAQVEAQQIETALRSYYTDNRGWKDLSGSDMSAAVVAVLRGGNGKIPYMEFNAKTQVGSPMKDPWENTYKISLCDSDNKVTGNGTSLSRACAVWSKGPNGVEDGDVPGSDDVCSWK